MVLKAPCSGISAIGSTQAWFFHPSECIRQQWPNTYQMHRLEGAIIIGDGEEPVRHQVQQIYQVLIPDIDDGTIFHIMAKNFKVLTAPLKIFEAKCPLHPTTTCPLTVYEEEVRRSLDNVQQNVSSGMTQDNIAGSVNTASRSMMTTNQHPKMRSRNRPLKPAIWSG